MLWELIFNKNAALRSSEVSSSLPEALFVKWLVDNAYTWSPIDCHADHGGDMVEMTLGEAFCAIKGVDPDYHVVFEKLIGKLVKVVVSLRGGHSINLLHL